MKFARVVIGALAVTLVLTLAYGSSPSAAFLSNLTNSSPSPAQNDSMLSNFSLNFTDQASSFPANQIGDEPNEGDSSEGRVPSDTNKASGGRVPSSPKETGGRVPSTNGERVPSTNLQPRGNATNSTNTSVVTERVSSRQIGSKETDYERAKEGQEASDFPVASLAGGIDQYRAEIGKTVKWKRKVMIKECGELRLDLPESAENITVRNTSETIDEDDALFFGIMQADDEIIYHGDIPTAEENGGRVSKAEEPETDEFIKDVGPGIYEVEYYTEAPQAFEESISSRSKKVTVIAPDELQYQNILAYTTLPDAHLVKTDNAGAIKLMWHVDGGKQETSYEAFDTDDDGYLDYIEWYVPHLSNQTYEVNISIINVQSYPKLFGDWTVKFKTLGTANLTITGLDDTDFGDELIFRELRCGDTILTPQIIGNSLFYPNYNCDEQTGFEISKVMKAGKHTLVFEFGGENAYAYNDFVTTCGTLNSPNTVYYVQNKLDGAQTCLTISGDNITVDCQGNEIYYDKDNVATRYGIYISSGSDDVTIKNCNIISNGTTAANQYAIYIYNSKRATIYNNNITTNLSSAYGVHVLTNCEDTNITGNNITTTGSSGHSTYIRSNSDRTIIIDNILDAKGTSGRAAYVESSDDIIIRDNTINSSIGVQITQSDNVTVENNDIYSTAQYGFGIMLQTTTNSLMTKNDIITGRVNTFNYGLRLYSSSTHNTITHNTVDTENGYSYGLYLQDGCSHNTFDNNSIITDNADAVRISATASGSTTNNTFTNHTINVGGLTRAAIISYDGANNFTVANSTLLHVEVNGYDIDFGGSSDGIVNFTNVSFSTKRINANSDAKLYVKWYVDVNVTSSGSPLSGANVSAWDKAGTTWLDNVTTDSDGFGRNVLAEYWQNNTNTYYYSNYTINVTMSGYGEESEEINLTGLGNRQINFTMHLGCGDLDSAGYYVMTKDLSSTGTCFDISSDNVTIDCGGYKIDGGSTGSGIHLADVNNITIANCTILNFNYGVDLDNVDASEIYDIEVYDSGSQGILLVDSNDNDIHDVTVGDPICGVNVTTSDDTTVEDSLIANNTYGICVFSSLRAILSNNTITNNSVSGIYISGSDGAMIDDNRIETNTTRWSQGIYVNGANIQVINNSIRWNSTANASGIYFTELPAGGTYHTNISNNTIWVNGAGAAGILTNATPGDSSMAYSDIADNTIRVTGSDFAYGFGDEGTTAGGPFMSLGYDTITGNIFSIAASAGECVAFGVGLDDGGVMGASVIKNNTFRCNGTAEVNGLMLIYGPGTDNIVENNSITVSSTAGTSYGFHLFLNSWSENNTISNLRCNASSDVAGGGVRSFAFRLESDVDPNEGDNRITGCFLNATAANADSAAMSLNSRYNQIWDNELHGDYGVIIPNGDHNVFWDNNITSTKYGVNLTNSAVNNTFLNCSYDNEYVGTGCELIRQWYVQLNVTQSGLPKSDVNVSFYNSTGDLIVWNMTDANGLTEILNITVYRNVSGTTLDYNLYTINVTDGVERAKTTNITGNLEYHFNLDCGLIDIDNDYYLLNADVANFPATCFNVTAVNATLDCAGHTIDGTGNSGWAAVNATGADNFTLVNCTIKEWSDAIRIQSSDYSLLRNNTIRDITNRGIFLYHHNYSTIEDNDIENNNTATIYGIKAETTNNVSAFNNRIFSNSTGASSYCIHSDSASYYNITNNSMSGYSGSSTAHPVYLIAGSKNGVYSNTIIADAATNAMGIYFRINAGTSVYNKVEDNSIEAVSSGGYSIGVYMENLGGTAQYYDLRNNRANATTTTNDVGNLRAVGIGLYDIDFSNITGCTVNGTAPNAISIGGINYVGASNNIWWDNILHGEDYGGGSFLSSINNTFLNCSYQNSDLVDANSELIRQWYVQVNVTKGGIAESGVNVSLYNSSNDLIYWNTTDANGLTETWNLTEYKNISGTTHDWNPYKIIVIDGYVASRSTSFTDNTLYNFTFAGCSNIDTANTYFLLDANITNHAGTCFNITAANVTLDCSGYITDGTGLAGAAAVNATQADNLTIVNCTFTDWYQGIKNSYSDVSLFRNDTFKNITRYGIRFFYSNSTTIEDNYFESNSTAQSWVMYFNHSKELAVLDNRAYWNSTDDGTGIEIDSIGAGAINVSDVEIRNNTINIHYHEIIHLEHPDYGIRANVSIGLTPMVIANNSISVYGYYNTYGVHIDCNDGAADCDFGTIENNSIIVNSSDHGECMGIHMEEMEDGSISNNTINSTGYTDADGIIVDYFGSSNHIEENWVYVESGGVDPNGISFITDRTSSSNRIRDNRIRTNWTTDYGLYVKVNSGAAMSSNTFSGNRIISNGGVVAFYTEADGQFSGNILSNNTMSINGSYGMEVVIGNGDTANHNILENNTAEVYSTDDYAVGVMIYNDGGTMQYNRITDCRANATTEIVDAANLRGAGIVVYGGHYTNITGCIGNATAPNAMSTGVATYADADNNLLQDNLFYGGDYGAFTILGSINNTFLNCTYDNEYVDGTSELIRQWYVQVNVTKGGAALAGANVSLYNSSDDLIYWNTTDANGLTETWNLTEYKNISGTTHDWTPYEVFVINGITAIRSLDFDDNVLFNITLLSCMNITTANSYVLMEGDILERGPTCFNVTAANVTFDCGDYVIDGKNALDQIAINVTGDNVSIVNCTFTDWHDAIVINDTTYSFIRNNTFEHITQRGIALWSHSGSWINGNDFESNETSPDGSTGIYGYQASYLFIENNSIFVNSSNLSVGIWLLSQDVPTANVEIRNNTINAYSSQNRSWCFYADPFYRVVGGIRAIDNILFVNNSLTAESTLEAVGFEVLASVAGGPGHSFNNSLIANNTIFLNSSLSSYGVLIHPENTDIHNNSIYAEGTAWTIGLQLFIGNQVDVRHNDVRTKSGFSWGVSLWTRADTQSNTNFEDNNIRVEGEQGPNYGMMLYSWVIGNMTFNSFSRNNISVSGANDATGIYAWSDETIQINRMENNSIRTNATNTSTGVYFYTGGALSELMLNTIQNNSIIANSTDSYAVGVAFINDPGGIMTSNSILENRINATSGSTAGDFKPRAIGIYSEYADYNNASDNWINATAAGAGSVGVYLNASSDYWDVWSNEVYADFGAIIENSTYNELWDEIYHSETTGIYVLGDSDYTSIDNCTPAPRGTSIGVNISHSDNVRVVNSTIEGWDYGIRVANSLNATIWNNTLKGNDWMGISFLQSNSSRIYENYLESNNTGTSYGIHTNLSKLVTVEDNTVVWNSTVQSAGITIQDAIGAFNISRNSVTTYSTGVTASIYFDNISSNNYARNNTVHAEAAVQGYGIAITRSNGAANGNYIGNNSVRVSGAGANIGIYANPSNGGVFSSNTIAANPISVESTGSTGYGVHVDNTATFNSNLFANTTIHVNGSTESMGIRWDADSVTENNTASNISITADGAGSSIGVYIEHGGTTTYSNLFEYMKVNTSTTVADAGIRSAGIALVGADYNNVTRSRLNATGANAGSVGAINYVGAVGNMWWDNDFYGGSFGAASAFASTENIFLNCSYDGEYTDGTSSHYRQWYVQVNVTRPGDIPVPNANVSLYNVSDDLQDWGLTDANGFTKIFNMTQYKNDTGTTFDWTPYNVIVVDGITVEREMNFTYNKLFNITLLGCMNITTPNSYVLMEGSILDRGPTCFNISAENVTFDCNDHIIDGLHQARNAGINVTADNVSIINCTFTNWHTGININGTLYSLLRNDTFNNISGHGVHLYQHSGSTIIENFFHSNDTSSGGSNGLYIERGAGYMDIINNSFIWNTSNRSTAIRLTSNGGTINDFIMRNNTIKASSTQNESFCFAANEFDIFDDFTVLNNSCDSSAELTAYGIWFQPDHLVTNSTIVNNSILANSSTLGSISLAASMEATNLTNNDVECDANTASLCMSLRTSGYVNIRGNDVYAHDTSPYGMTLFTRAGDESNSYVEDNNIRVDGTHDASIGIQFYAWSGGDMTLNSFSRNNISVASLDQAIGMWVWADTNISINRMENNSIHVNSSNRSVGVYFYAPGGGNLSLNTVENNSIATNATDKYSMGIVLDNNPAGTMELNNFVDNKINATSASTDGPLAARAIGLYSEYADQNFMSDNRINATSKLAGAVGIYLNISSDYWDIWGNEVYADYCSVILGSTNTELWDEDYHCNTTGVYVTYNSDYTDIDNCTMDGNGPQYGIWIEDSDHVSVFNSTIFDFDEGIFTTNALYLTVQNNTLTNDTERGIHMVHTNSSIITNNYLETNTSNFTVYAMNIEASKDLDISDNIIKWNTTDITIVHGIGFENLMVAEATISNVNITNNTLIITTTREKAWGISNPNIEVGFNQIRILNNSIYVESENDHIGGINFKCNISAGAECDQNTIANNNIVVISPNENPRVSGITASMNSSTIANNTIDADSANQCRGMSLYMAENNIVENNTMSCDGNWSTGIEIYTWGSMSSNYIRENIVHTGTTGLTNFGIYIGSGSNTISSNHISDNQVYASASNGLATGIIAVADGGTFMSNMINNNLVHANASAFLYGISIAANAGGTAYNNTIQNASVRVNSTGDVSSGIYLIASGGTVTYNDIINVTVNSTSGSAVGDLRAAGIGFSNADSTNVTESNVNATASNSLASGTWLTAGSDNNVLWDNIFTGDDFGAYLNESSINNIYLNCTYDNEFVDGTSELIRQWYVQINVTNASDKEPLEGINVTLENRTLQMVYWNLTDANGLTETFNLTEYKNDTGTTFWWTNYTINLTKCTYRRNSTPMNFTNNILFNVSMTADQTPPVVDWNWTYLNRSTYANTTTVGINASEIVNCTLYFNGSIYVNETNAVNITWNQTNLPEGNYSIINVSCEDLACTDVKLSNVWWNIDQTPPVVTWTWEINTSSPFNITNITVETNERTLACNVEINGTNYSMSRASWTEYYYEWEGMDLGNYTMNVSCNDTVNNTGISTDGWYKILVPWHTFYGNISGEIRLGDAENDTMYLWDADDAIGWIYVADSDTSITWSNVFGLGRDEDGNPANRDFEEADIALNLTNCAENIKTAWSSDGTTPRYTADWVIDDTSINNIPVINSTNNWVFTTGILWDNSTDTDVEFDDGDAENLIFVANATSQQVGKYGTYDYEIRVPYSLDSYTGITNTVTFYIEITGAAD